MKTNQILNSYLLFLQSIACTDVYRCQCLQLVRKTPYPGAGLHSRQSHSNKYFLQAHMKISCWSTGAGRRATRAASELVQAVDKAAYLCRIKKQLTSYLCKSTAVLIAATVLVKNTKSPPVTLPMKQGPQKFCPSLYQERHLGSDRQVLLCRMALATFTSYVKVSFQVTHLWSLWFSLVITIM